MIRINVTKEKYYDDNIRLSSNYYSESNLEVGDEANIYDAFKMAIESFRIAGYSGESIKKAIDYFSSGGE